MSHNNSGCRVEVVSDSLKRTTVNLHETDGDPIVAEFFVKYACFVVNWSYVILTREEQDSRIKRPLSMSLLRASTLPSSPMPRTSRQILIFRVVRWMHGSNTVRHFCSWLDFSRLFFPCPRLLAHRFPQYCSWYCRCACCIPRFRGAR